MAERDQNDAPRPSDRPADANTPADPADGGSDSAGRPEGSGSTSHSGGSGGSRPPPTPEETRRLTEQIEQLIRQRQSIVQRLQKTASPAEDRSLRDLAHRPTAATPVVRGLPARSPTAAPTPAATVPDQTSTDAGATPRPSGPAALGPAAEIPPHLLDERLRARLEEAARLEAENQALRRELEERSKAPPRPNISVADFQALQNQNAVLKAKLARLEAQQDTTQAARSASEEQFKSLQQELAQVRALLAERDRLIEQLKIRLADAVLEQNRAVNDLRQAREDHEARLQDFARLRAEHAEFAQRLETAARNEQTLLAEIKRLADELRAAQEGLVEARHARDALEKELDQRIVELNRAREQAKKVADQALDVDHLRHLLNAAEARERDLIVTLDGLQRERTRLQERLSRLLTGVQQYINAPPALPAEGTEGPPHEPFGPFLPFCFPDRTPRALRISWRRTLPHPELPQRPAPPPATLAPRPRRFFQHFLRPTHGIPQHIPVLKLPLLELQVEPCFELNTRLPIRGFEIPPHAEWAFDAAREFRPRPRHLLPRTVAPHASPLPGPVRLYLAPVALPILTWSPDLYLGFLLSTISRFRRALSRTLEYRPPRPAEPGLPFRPLGRPPTPGKFLPERVAYRSHSQLKFAPLAVPRDRLVPDFQRRRLQSLFKTFGDSFSSVFSRLEQLLQPSPGQPGEPSVKKPTGPQEDV
ncbi:MAG: hypothetical protein OZSIB_4265 [Candidatus Ozemobacter sibiricus]|uniref:ANTAR domain-containing protein n=1 Tax=Candidatus Ozemobacter sibiricus TaxID=2268124 RepID=A0A367ZQ78_9BACT|nr:MAG: hypothetical protein OZSIB_4265 [Candidatus Ozemobacter sibiricus]